MVQVLGKVLNRLPSLYISNLHASEIAILRKVIGRNDTVGQIKCNWAIEHVLAEDGTMMLRPHPILVLNYLFSRPLISKMSRTNQFADIISTKNVKQMSSKICDYDLLWVVPVVHEELTGHNFSITIPLAQIVDEEAHVEAEVGGVRQ